MLLPRIALFFLFNAHLRSAVVGDSIPRPARHQRHHRQRDSRSEQRIKDNIGLDDKRQEQLFNSDANRTDGQQLETTTGSGSSQQDRQSFGFVQQKSQQDDASHTKSPLNSESGEEHQSEHLSSFHDQPSKSNSATNAQSSDGDSLSASSPKLRCKRHRHRRHHHHHYFSRPSRFNHPLSDPTNFHNQRLSDQQLVMSATQIARKFARASNTEIPDIPGMDAAQREQLFADDAHLVVDTGGLVTFQVDANQRYLTQDRLSSKLAPQMLILSRLFGDSGRTT
uniref:Uncharacterized protein n=2 Tax=Plectus sambesii TaxID=2011161 RepID=A0A914VDQ9_9BILA